MSGETEEDTQRGRFSVCKRVYVYSSERMSVRETEKARTGGHGEKIEAAICCHCHGYCRNDSVSGRP